MEGTIAQATHVTGIRRARYPGLPKTRLEHNTAAAAVLLLLAVWAGWTAQHRFGDPSATVSVMTRAGAPGSGLVPVVPSAFYGIPAATAALRLDTGDDAAAPFAFSVSPAAEPGPSPRSALRPGEVLDGA